MAMTVYPTPIAGDVDAASSALTYNADGTLATVTERDTAGRTLRVSTLTYTAGVLSSVTEVAGGRTRTTTLTYTAGVLTSTAVS